VVALALSTGAVRAQNAQDKAAADVLFQQGKKLMQEGKAAEACPRFAESLRLDTGIGTMLWLADCYERSGKTASAWAQFQEAAETAATAKDPREKVARQRVGQLEPKLIRLQIEVASSNEVRGLEVKRDGTLLGKPLWGTAVPVDPGGHAVSASAPGFKTWEGSVDASGDGQTLSVQVPRLVEDAPVHKDSDPLPMKNPEETKSATGGSQRVIGLAVAGVGVVGVGIGAVFGLNAKSKLDESYVDAHCQPNSHCDKVGYEARTASKDAAAFSTVAFLVGAAALGTGAVLYLTAPKSPAKGAVVQGLRVTPAVGRSGAGMGLAGSF